MFLLSHGDTIINQSAHVLSLNYFLIQNIITQVILTENSEKSEPQMGFELTTLRDLVGCSNHSATGDSVTSKGEMWVFDSSCITQLQSEITTDSIAHNCITQSPLSISEMHFSDVAVRLFSII